MTIAAEIMREGVECAEADETVTVAAAKMRDLGVGALPICGSDRKLAGILTDRDIVVKCIAEGHDPTTCTASEMAAGRPFYVDANSDLDTVLQQMMEYRIKRMPVIRDRQLVGMISEADLAQNLSEDKLTQLLEYIKSGPSDRVSY